MTTGCGILGIGYPSMLGNFGLNTSGAYGSYDACMPSMMGMNNSLFTSNPMMNPMMSMYNPMYYAQAYQNYEASQVDHAGNMHTKITNNGVKSYKETDSALVQKVAQNGDVQQHIKRLHVKVVEGDQNGICREYDSLRQAILSTYRDEIVARAGKVNPLTTASQIIDNLYASIITAQNQANGITEQADLEADIRKHGDGALVNGFASGLRSGHHDKYVDETLQHIYGYDIDRQGSKEFGRSVAKGVGSAASVLEKGVYGAAIGAAGYGVSTGVGKLLASAFGAGGKINFNCKWLKIAAAVGAIAGMAADIWWQCSGKDDNK